MNRTVKDATIKAFHYPDLESLEDHVLAFLSAYNLAKHLKALWWKRSSKLLPRTDDNFRDKLTEFLTVINAEYAK